MKKYLTLKNILILILFTTFVKTATVVSWELIVEPWIEDNYTIVIERNVATTTESVATTTVTEELSKL